MSRSLLCCLALLAVAPLAAAQTDWREELSQDQVVFRDGKMVYDDYGLVQINLQGHQPASFQVRAHSEAPQGGLVSRDNFVALSSTMSYLILTTVFAEVYQVTASTFLSGFKMTPLRSLIGNPDFEINMYMTDEGIQVEVAVTTTGQRTRWTQRWADIYAE